MIVDTPLGSQADDALGALAIGDTLAVAAADHRRELAIHQEPQHPACHSPHKVRATEVGAVASTEFSEYRVIRDLDFDPARTAVIVVDMLNDFLEPGGAMPLLEGRTPLRPDPPPSRQRPERTVPA